jgi:hypothetical protein
MACLTEMGARKGNRCRGRPHVEFLDLRGRWPSLFYRIARRMSNVTERLPAISDTLVRWTRRPRADLIRSSAGGIPAATMERREKT